MFKEIPKHSVHCALMQTDILCLKIQGARPFPLLIMYAIMAVLKKDAGQGRQRYSSMVLALLQILALYHFHF